MKIYAYSEKGPNKKENEDRIAVNKTILTSGFFFDELENGFVAIADGVGGNNAGAIASHFVATELGESNRSVDDLKNINAKLIAQSKNNLDKVGMATTLAMVEFGKNDLRLVYVGNTRIYLLNNGKYLKRLSTDDTTLEYLLSTGRITEEEVESFDRKNEITACFGGGNPNLLSLKETIHSFNSSPFLITSDGIHDYLTVDEMEDLLSSNYDLSDKLKGLVKQARKNGSNDDASVVLGVF